MSRRVWTRRGGFDSATLTSAVGPVDADICQGSNGPGLPFPPAAASPNARGAAS